MPVFCIPVIFYRHRIAVGKHFFIGCLERQLLPCQIILLYCLLKIMEIILVQDFPESRFCVRRPAKPPFCPHTLSAPGSAFFIFRNKSVRRFPAFPVSCQIGVQILFLNSGFFLDAFKMSPASPPVINSRLIQKCLLHHLPYSVPLFLFL